MSIEGDVVSGINRGPTNARISVALALCTCSILAGCATHSNETLFEARRAHQTDLESLKTQVTNIEKHTAAYAGRLEFVHGDSGIFSAMTDPNAPVNRPPTIETVPLAALYNTLGRPLKVTYENRQNAGLGTPHRSWTFDIPFPDDFPRDGEISILPTVTRLQAPARQSYVISTERTPGATTWQLTLTLMEDAKVERIQIAWIVVAVPKHGTR